MLENFKVVIEAATPIAKLTHKQQVMRLYRKSLRAVANWAESRELFNTEASKIRAEFDANKDLPADGPQTTYFVNRAKERLAYHTHPDPIIAPYMPGGTLFMRNPSFPLEVLYPHGIPEGVSRRRLNIDMSNIPDDQPYADKVYVESINKTYHIDK